MKGYQTGRHCLCWEPRDLAPYPPTFICPESGGEVDPKVTGNEIAGNKVTADADSEEPPSPRTAAVERLVEAGERLRRTLARPRGVPFPSTVRPYLQALLELLTGDAAEDFQELQDSSLLFYWFSPNSRDDRRLKKLRIASAFEKALKHQGISPFIHDAMKLLLEVKDKLFHPSIRDPLSTLLFGNLLQVISEELQGAEMEVQKQKNTQPLVRRLNEDTCLDLAALLQRTVKFLEARENRSREVVQKVDEADQACWNTWHWYLHPASLIFNWSGLEMRDKDSKELPPSRTAAARRLVKARERLKATLARHGKRKSGAPSIFFLSTVKPYLQALLEVLTGEIEEDFQKLQDRFHGLPCLDRKRYMKSRIATAFEEAMRHPETSLHLKEAVKLLLEVKDKLFRPSIRDPPSAILFGNLLQVISEELQTEQIKTEEKKNSHTSELGLDEDACLDLVSLLQKAVKFLEARENRSREKVMKVDEGDSSSWESWYWDCRLSSEIVDMRIKAKRQEEVGKKLKKTLAGWKKRKPGTSDVPFPSTVRLYLQGLLDILTGDATEDVQKLQDASHHSYKLRADLLHKRRHRKRKVAAAFKEAMKHQATSSLIGEAVKLLPKIKEKLLHPFEKARQSAKVIGSLLQDISEKLQRAETGMKEDSQAFGRSLDEDACLDLASLLQKSVELLEDWEDPSREEVTQEDEDDPNCSESLDQQPDVPPWIFDGLKDGFERGKEVLHYLDVVFDLARLFWTCLLVFSLKARVRLLLSSTPHTAGSIPSHPSIIPQTSSCPGRAWKGVMTSVTHRLLGLLLLASILGGVAASPLPASARVQGSGRAEQGQAYRLTCVVEGLPGTDTISSYVWYKDGNIIRNETKQILTFTRLTQGDAGNYQCGPQLPDRPELLLSRPFQLSVLVLQNVVMVPEVEVEEGETVILNCSVHSVPTARLCWMMDAKILRCVESNSDSLVLHNASRFHLKVVHCQASNREFFKILGADTQIRIKGTYEVMPKPLLSMEGLPVLHQPFKLLCIMFDFPEHTAHIRLSYTWFKDHREIPGQSGEELQFDSLTREDRGVYSCISRNGKPETTSPESNKRDLLVLLPPSVHMEPATADSVIRRAAGEELTLTCKVTEAIPWVPADGYSWSYLPSHLGPLRPLEVRESTLRLGSLTREHSGQYFCQARNDLHVFQGQIPPGKASITVDVVYLENITLTPDLEVNKDDHVILTCTVNCNSAARLTWIVDGREARHVTANIDHYVLERAACSDSKTYTCRASNPDLPGLESSASTNVRVACIGTVTDLPFPSSSPLNSSQDVDRPGPSSPPPLWLWALLPWTLLLWAHTTAIISLYCCSQKFREKVDGVKAYFMKRKRASDEEKSDQGSSEAVPLN